MLSSVYKEIPDDSITGAKIKDGTDVDYFGDVVFEERLDVRSDGSNRISLRGSTDFGRIVLRDDSVTNVILLDAEPATDNYINHYIVFGSTTFPQPTLKSTYPLQVVGGIYASGTIYGAGAITAAGTLTCNTLDSNGISGTSITAFGLITGQDGQLKIGSYQPTPTNWSKVMTLDQSLGTGNSPIFSNLQITSPGNLTIMGGAVPDSVWQYVKTMDQPVNTSNPVSFDGVQSTSFLGGNVSLNPGSWDTSSSSIFFAVYTGTAGSYTITLDASDGAERMYIVHNSPVSTDTITLSPAASNSITGGPTTVAAGETVLMTSIYGGPNYFWYTMKIAG